MVSLLVRLWIEICITVPPFWQPVVSLLVRLWIEMLLTSQVQDSCRSASLWGCELKYIGQSAHHIFLRQPPCEAVNWNNKILSGSAILIVSLLVRLWIEMLLMVVYCHSGRGQPPCEAVNWNPEAIAPEIEKRSQPPCEAVNWNVSVRFGKNRRYCQPPCEAVNWNVKYWASLFTTLVSLLVRLWIEIL